MGLFKVTTGVMGSSKSSRAIADVKNLRYAGHRVLVIKPKQDSRDGDKICSRLINETIKADIILGINDRLDKVDIINNNYDFIIADELHMFSTKTIEDLYEISAISDTEVHLYGLSMSWKGKPFMSTALALAYADKIDKIEVTDKHKNLLTHHIKKVGNVPCDITTDDGEIEIGDIGQEQYSTVSKQTFYNIYGMLGQLNVEKINNDNIIAKEDRSITKSIENDNYEENDDDTSGPKIGSIIKIDSERLRDLCPEKYETVKDMQFVITDKKKGKYAINLLIEGMGQVLLFEDEFKVIR